MALGVAQLLKRLAIILNLQERIKLALANRGRCQKITGKGSLLHSQRIREKSAQFNLTLQRQMLAQPVNDIGFLLHQALVNLGVIDIPGRWCPTTAHHRVLHIINSRLERHRHLPTAFALAYKLRLVVWEVIKQRKPDSFNQRRLPSAILTANRGRPPAQFNAGMAITLNIFKFNSGDEHASLSPGNEIRIPVFFLTILKKGKKSGNPRTYNPAAVVQPCSALAYQSIIA